MGRLYIGDTRGPMDMHGNVASRIMAAEIIEGTLSIEDPMRYMATSYSRVKPMTLCKGLLIAAFGSGPPRGDGRPGSSGDHLRINRRSNISGGRYEDSTGSDKGGRVDRRGSGLTRSSADARHHSRAARGDDGPIRGDGEGRDTCSPARTTSSATGPADVEDAASAGSRHHYLQPPGWLYLPAQGIFGGAHHVISRADLSARVAPASATCQRDAGGEHPGNGPWRWSACTGAAGAAIRGRGDPPGANDAVDAGPEVARRVPTPPIRGQSALPGARRADGKSSAQSRLEGSNAHIAISLRDHAERVAAKSKRQGGCVQGATAAQRLEALRRRIEARVNTAGRCAPQADELGPRRVEDQATDTAGHTPETGGYGQAAPAVGTIEVQKMHYHRDPGDDGTADLQGIGAEVNRGVVAGSSEGEDPSCGDIATGMSRCVDDVVQIGATPTPAAVAAAARAVAWHSVSALNPPRGPG